MELSFLPTLNAALNTTATILLLVAHRQILLRRVDAHRNIMLTAATVSVLFLVSYLTYHYNHGSQGFQSQGIIRIAYFFVLLSHTILAALLAFLVPLTLYRGLRRQDNQHRRIAPWTYRIWLYVSATGVLIYLMLYHLDPLLAG